MTETLAAPLAVLALLCLVEPQGRTPEIQLFLAGALVALAALCRSTFLVWAAPVGFALLLASRTPYLRRLWLAGVVFVLSVGKRLTRYAVGAWYAALLVLAVVGVGVLGRQLCDPPWLWGLLLCLTFTAMHAIYWSNLRMRAPLMPILCLAATVGVRWIVSRAARPHAAGQESSP